MDGFCSLQPLCGEGICLQCHRPSSFTTCSVPRRGCISSKRITELMAFCDFQTLCTEVFFLCAMVPAVVAADGDHNPGPNLQQQMLSALRFLLHCRAGHVLPLLLAVTFLVLLTVTWLRCTRRKRRHCCSDFTCPDCLSSGFCAQECHL